MVKFMTKNNELVLSHSKLRWYIRKFTDTGNFDELCVCFSKFWTSGSKTFDTLKLNFKTLIFKMSQQLDNKILELRLLIKDTALSQASVSKCAAKLQAFGKKLNDKNALEGFIREILLYKLECEKTSKMFSALERQAEEYTVLESTIEQRIADTKLSIMQLERELEEQKVIRAHRLECEELSMIVNKHKTRSDLKRKIDAVNETLDGTKASIELVDNEIAHKHALFKRLLTSIEDYDNDGKIQEEEVVQEVPNGAEEESGAAGTEEGEDREARETRHSKEESNNKDEQEVAGNDEVELDEDGNPVEVSEDQGMEDEGNNDIGEGLNPTDAVE
jgi:hypothetical protein